MKLYLIRHGQTAWNREQVFRGGTDIELDETGREQAGRLAERLKSSGVSRIYSGPLSRARQTAKAVADACGREVVIDPGLDDMRFGQWEGLAHTEVAEKFPEAYSLWKSEPWRAVIPGGSSLDEVGRRAWAALHAIVSDAGERETVAVVTHRVVLKLLALRMLGLGPEGFWRVKLSPCSLSVFEWDGKNFTMETFNDTCHLAEMRGHNLDF
jgi:broad specificity phosphatase PhoE